MRTGAYDYLTKPVDPERLLITVGRAAERRSLAAEVNRLRQQICGEGEIVAQSSAMRRMLSTVAQVASTDSTVLITGESGTGKELVARAIHRQGDRSTGRFVPVICGAIPETLLESELFGHRKGAFTGAVTDKKGLLEEAHRGVLFLDEIGEIPTSMQVRLLRFLQGGEVRRIGDTETRRVDVRIVAATHRSLEDEVAEGRFRQDFYYRIHVVNIAIPPLRERPDDIPPLAQHFLSRLATKMRRSVEGFTPEALRLMKGYRWPGNVRELENAIERALNIASGRLVTEGDLPAEVSVAPGARQYEMPDGERERLVRALESCRWNHGRAAASLGMSRTTLWRKLREHRIDA
jgi:DNA-binding NtrC family response regulator